MSDFSRVQELARAAGLQVNPPSMVAAPSISPETAAVGVTLNGTTGEWTGEPTYTYQWLSNGVEVGTAASYAIAAGDAGHSITYAVTATNDVGSIVAPSSNAVTVPAAARAARRVEPAHEAHAEARRK